MKKFNERLKKLTSIMYEDKYDAIKVLNIELFPTSTINNFPGFT